MAESVVVAPDEAQQSGRRAAPSAARPRRGAAPGQAISIPHAALSSSTADIDTGHATYHGVNEAQEESSRQPANGTPASDYYARAMVAHLTRPIRKWAS
jgi:hypothetical protein